MRGSDSSGRAFDAREPSRLSSREIERRTAREIDALPPHARIAIPIVVAVSVLLLSHTGVIRRASVGTIHGLRAVIIDEIGIGEHVEIVFKIKALFLLLIMFRGNDVQVGKVLGHIRCASTGEGHCRLKSVVFSGESRTKDNARLGG